MDRGGEARGAYSRHSRGITDEVVWEKLTSGEWGPVSVVIKAFKVTCSLCGDDITDGPDEHIVSGSGHEVIESFEFDRVDFVSNPAYTDAGVIKLELLNQNESDFIQKQDGNYGTSANPKIPQKKRKQNMSELETLQEQVKDLTEKNKQLQAQLQQTEKGSGAPKAKFASVPDDDFRVAIENAKQRLFGEQREAP